jgi:hypothetical protein
MKRGDYDYHHATTNTQFIALLLVLGIIAGGGLVLGLAILGFIL